MDSDNIVIEDVNKSKDTEDILVSYDSYYIATIIIVLLIIVIFYIKKFKITTLPSTTSTSVAPVVEKFSPYESTLTHDMKRSDPAFDDDANSANPLGRSSEFILFNQLNNWISNVQ
jgi:hypothetical protein